MSRTPSHRRSEFTPVQRHSASTKSLAPVEIVDSWDSAIAKAKQKIACLKDDIVTFQEMKESGEPWPGTVTQLQPTQSTDQKSEAATQC
jgi:hypothetical protein